MDLQFLRSLHEGGSAVAPVRLDTARDAHHADKQTEPPRTGRAAVLGGAGCTEILPPAHRTDGVAALPRH